MSPAPSRNPTATYIYIHTFKLVQHGVKWMARYCSIAYCRWSRRAHSVAWLGSVTWLSEPSDAVGPSAPATVDEFKAVPGHSFLMMLRCPQPATTARKRKAGFNMGSEGLIKDILYLYNMAWHNTDTTCTRNSGMCVCRPPPRLNKVFQKFHQQDDSQLGCWLNLTPN